MRVVFWDIETVAKKREELDALMPDDIKNPVLPYDLANPVVPNFEHGAMTDPVKLATWREKKVADFHSEHRAKVAKWTKDAESDRFKFYDRAALSATTCEVKLIGLRSVEIIPPSSPRAKQKEKVETFILCSEKIDGELAKEYGVVCFQDEARMLSQFWDMVHSWRTREGAFLMTGWNSNRFDIRIVRLRSAARRIRIKVPILGASGYPVADLWKDLMQDYACGDKQTYTSIGEAAKCLGIPGKKTDGGQFGKLWETDKRAALAYLRDDDLRLNEAIGRLLIPAF